MAYTALYRKFRPQTFSEVIGQEHIKKTLKNQIKSGRVGHAYLLNGTRGTGKTSIAKILARAVNCENPIDGEPCNECEICKAILDGSLTDVVEMDAASNNSVEDIREIRNEVNFLPTRAKYRVYIIDEVHMLSTGAFNALLKTLEEPPEHVKFILATTEPQKIPATILSRCQRFDFKKIPDEEIIQRLKYVCKESNANITDGALKIISVLSEGAMRDALSILERCLQDGEENIDEEKVKDLIGIPKIKLVHSITEALIDGDCEKVIDEIETVKNDGKDLTNFLWEIIKYIKDVLIFKVGKNVDIYSEEDKKQIMELTQKVTKEKLLNMIFKLSEMDNSIKQSTQKSIIFESGLLGLCIDDKNKDLMERVEILENKINSGNITVKPRASINNEETKKYSYQNQEVYKEPRLTETIQKAENKKEIEVPKKVVSPSSANSKAFWPDVLQKLKENGKLMIYANLLNTRAVEINDMTLGIEFPNGLNDFRKNLLEKNENIHEIERLVSIACGKEMRIKYIDTSSGVKHEKIAKPSVVEKTTKEENKKEFNNIDDLEDLGLPINYIDE